MAVGGSGLLLQYLGPPERRASSIGAVYPRLASGAEVLPRTVHPLKKIGSITSLVPSLAAKTEVDSTTIDITRLSYDAGDTQNLADADPQRAIVENEEAIVELQRRLKRFEPEIDTSLGANSATPEASPSRVLPDSTDTLTGTTENLSAPIMPFSVVKANVVPYATTISTAQSAQDSLTGVSSPSQADVQVPSHRGDGLVLPEISLASTETILADAAASPNMSADKLQNAPEAATTSLTVVLPVLPEAKRNANLVQDLLPPDFDASASPTEPASTAQTQILMKAAPSRGPENTPLLSPSATMLAEIMVRRADALLQHGDISAARLLYERAAAAGSGHAATAMGKTFDATFLAGVGVIGMGADPTLAATWYRRALELGDAEARTRLQAPPPAANRISTASKSHP